MYGNNKYIKIYHAITIIVILGASVYLYFAFIYDDRKLPNYYELWHLESSRSIEYNESIDMIKQNGDKNHYINYLYGFQFSYPSVWKIDNHHPEIYTRLYNEDFKIDISYQNLEEVWSTKKKFLKSTLEHLEPYKISEQKWEKNDIKYHMFSYKRKPLIDSKDDLNYYSYLFIIKDKEIFTFHLKTNEKDFDTQNIHLEHIAKSFKIIEKQKFDNLYNVNNHISNNIEDTYNNKTISIPENSFVVGLFEPDQKNIKKVEKELDSQFGSQMFYYYIDSYFDPTIQDTIDEGRIPIVTYQFYSWQNPEDKDIVQNIINGEYDNSIENWANGIKTLNSPIYIRLANEMNGHWVNWGPNNTYNDSDLYKIAYRYIVNKFRDMKVENARFIWNPNDVSDPYLRWNNAYMYYPGDNYVDIIGMTSYNWGKSEWTEFKYFDDLYKKKYEEYLRLYPTKPFIIGEFASAEKGGSKSEFIKDMFYKITTSYPNIKMVIWFNKDDKDYALRIDSSKKSIKSFKEGMENPFIIKNPYDN